MTLLCMKRIFKKVYPQFNSVTKLLAINRSYISKFTSTTSMSEAAALRLCVVPPEEYDQFADALREFLPHSYQVEAMLRGHLKYGHLDILGASLWAPASQEHRHHLAVISPSASTKERCMFSIYWNDRRLPDDTVSRLLRSLPISTWHQPIMIRQMPSHLLHKMDAILQRISDGDLQVFAYIPVHVYSLAPEDTPPVPQLPEGYYFGSLNRSHAEEVLPRWPECKTETLECFMKYLDTLPSAAVFHKPVTQESDQTNVNETDTLVSYSMYKPGSDVGITYTKENHRRKGLARAVTLQLAHKLHRDGLPITSLVDVGYDTSVKLHTSMGFRHYTDVAFPFYFPKLFDFSSLSYFSHFKKCFPESLKRWEETWHIKNS